MTTMERLARWRQCRWIDDTDRKPEISTAGGGSSNTASGWVFTVSGGKQYLPAAPLQCWRRSYNTASNSDATVGGGLSTASGSCAAAGGGSYNTASAYASAVGRYQAILPAAPTLQQEVGQNNTANTPCYSGRWENNQSTTGLC